MRHELHRVICATTFRLTLKHFAPSLRRVANDNTRPEAA